MLCACRSSASHSGERNDQAAPGAAEQDLAQQYDEEVLRDPAFKPFYIVGEKILAKSERMPEDWPIFSTTGYVFLNSVNGIFIDGEQAKAFDAIYEKFIRTRVSVQDVIYEKKKLVMQSSMSSEVNTLGHYLNDLSEKDRHTRDFTLYSLRSAIIEVTAAFPVYRTYTNTWLVNDRDRQVVELAVSKAKRNNPAVSESIFDFLKQVLLLRFPKEFSDENKAEWLDFVMRFQQITGPVMAKGVEDTAFYVYNRLVSLNEVGGMPERFGTPLETFHGQNVERMKSWPHALITTETHDTKRSEGVRARINVLSEIPGEWSERVRTWARLNKKKKGMIAGSEAPSRNEEYLLYQTLVGAWPVEGVEGNAFGVFAQRIKDYMIKASLEAKVNTSSDQSECGIRTSHACLHRPDPAAVAAEPVFERFSAIPAHDIALWHVQFHFPDTAQDLRSRGARFLSRHRIVETSVLWTLIIRRPVDYEKRVSMLAELRQKEAAMTAVQLARDLSLNKEDGRIMLYLVHKALDYRRENRPLFEQGEYLPLTDEGARAGHVCAFERKLGGTCIVVAVPRFLTRLISGGGSVPFGEAVWEDTRLSCRRSGRECSSAISSPMRSSSPFHRTASRCSLLLMSMPLFPRQCLNR